MRNITKALLIGSLSTAAVLGGSTAAFAQNPPATINYVMYAPNHTGGSDVEGSITWSQYCEASYSGTVWDENADGHGPYAHLIGHAYQNGLDSGTPIVTHLEDVHNTLGTGTGKPFSSSYYHCDQVPTNLELHYINVWICNGGNVDGYGVDGGCYGRRAWNQVTNPGRGSDNLGWTTGAIY